MDVPTIYITLESYFDPLIALAILGNGAWHCKIKCRAVSKGGNTKALALKQVIFEKDDDIQMEFVSACANLRARNY